MTYTQAYIGRFRLLEVAVPAASDLSQNPATTHLIVLGTPEVRRNGRPLTLQPKQFALLAYLVLGNARRVHRRDHLIGLFWPEKDSSRARAALRQALRGLRRSLGENTILTRGDEEVVLNAEHVSCDVHTFEGSLGKDLAAAVAVYQGPFLQGFHIKGCAEFERWVETMRDRLGRAFASSLEQLAREARNRGDATTALAWWRRLATHDPYSEHVASELIQALVDFGDSAAAHAHAIAFQQLLEEELGVAPSEDLRKVIRRVEVGARQGGQGSGAPVADQGDSKRQRSRAVKAARERNPTAGTVKLVARLAAVAFVAIVAVQLISPDDQPLAENRIAIGRFENRTGDSAFDALGQYVAGRVRQRVQAVEQLEILPTWTTTIAWQLVTADDARVGVENPVAALARETGAGIVVSGWYYEHGDSLYFYAEITEHPKDRLVGAVGPIAAVGNTFTPAADSLATLVTERIAFDRDALFNPQWMEAFADPPKLDAYQAYSSGMELFSSFRFEAAIPQFERAVYLDSSFIEPLIWAMFAQSHIGNRVAVDTLTRFLEQRRDRLTPLLRHMLDERIALLRGDWNAALEILRSQMELVRDPTAFELGWVATLVNRPREAVAALETLDPDRGWLRLWLSYWVRLADAHHIGGDYRSELRTAARGLQSHHANPALSQHELMALAALGRSRQVHDKLEEAKLLQGSFWRIAVSTGLELAAHGRRERSREVFEDALGWLEGRGPEEQQTPGHQLRMGHTLYLLGRWVEARQLFDSLAQEEPDEITYVGWAGVTAARMGDAAAADSLSRVLETHDQPYRYSRNKYWQARIAAVLGERDRAVACLRDAIRMGFMSGSSDITFRFTAYPIVFHGEPDLESLRGFEPYEKLMEPKG